MTRDHIAAMPFLPRRQAILAVTLFAALALLTAACSVNAGSGQASNATIGFVSPSDGATVSIPFDVELKASEPLGDPSTGDRHAHIYFDTGTDAADYDIVYGTSWQVTRQLTPGRHTLTVALANADHSLAGPTQQITVTVAAGANGSNGGQPTDSGSAKPSQPAPPPRQY